MSNTPSKAEIEALAQQHLKAFVQFILGEVWFEGEVEFARAVLAKWGQPAQAAEPVAWLNPWRADKVTTDYDAYGERGIPLYAAPQPVVREPLTDEQIERDRPMMVEPAAYAAGVRYAEKHHGIKGGQHGTE